MKSKELRRFESVEDVIERLGQVGYLATRSVATRVFLADALDRPLLIEGPAGVGKTELARAVSEAVGADLIRLQCYEGVDESKALYEWNHARQILWLTAERQAGWENVKEDLFSEEFLLERPLLSSIRATQPTVLIIDEADKADVEIEGLLLEVLGEFQVTIPELGTVKAKQKPFVILTSNATRELSEALRRRCLYLHIDYPAKDFEEKLIRLKVPQLDESLAGVLVSLVHDLRTLPLRKSPSISETLDWARTLVTIGASEITDEVIIETLGVVLKHQDDIHKAIGAITSPVP